MIINIKVNIINHFKENYQIDPKITEKLYDEGILSYKTCRDLLLRNEYQKEVEPKMRNRIKLKLAEKYCVSFASVEKIISKV
jgi:hypothetical protein